MHRKCTSFFLTFPFELRLGISTVHSLISPSSLRPSFLFLIRTCSVENQAKVSSFVGPYGSDVQWSDWWFWSCFPLLCLVPAVSIGILSFLVLALFSHAERFRVSASVLMMTCCQLYLLNLFSRAFNCKFICACEPTFVEKNNNLSQSTFLRF